MPWFSPLESIEIEMVAQSTDWIKITPWALNTAHGCGQKTKKKIKAHTNEQMNLITSFKENDHNYYILSDW